MEPSSVLSLRQEWENTKAAKIAYVEKLIKGRCVLRDRHWIKLIEIWQNQFFTDKKVNRHSPLFLVEWQYSGYLLRNSY